MNKTETYTQTNWSLADLFPGINSPELAAAFKKIEERVANFEKRRSELDENMDAAAFLALVKQLEDTHHLLHRLFAYAELVFAGDTQDQAAQGLLARVEHFGAEMGNRTLFFSLWWKQISEENAARLMSPAGDYRYWLEEIRHFKPYTLTEPEEKIINIKNVTGASALGTLYDTITNRYVFKVEVDGKKVEMTRGELMVYVRHADPVLRARAYQELYRVYGEDSPILGQIYQALVRDWRNEQIGLRGFSSPIAVRNLANDIPDEVVETLLEVSRKNTGVFQRFFQLKARWLGMERLRRYDIYAPLAESDQRYTYSQAAAMTLDAFNEFDPLVSRLAQRVLDQNHVDSLVRKGKRGGAFCLTATPDLTPWVLLNFQGKADDVSTMAHELGHAIHSMLASEHSLFTAHASLPLAETASTFGEMLLVDRLLKEEENPAIRRDLLFSQADDAYATIQRQAYFALFERQAHEMIQQGASTNDLSEVYLSNLKDQFGGAVEVSDEFRWEWVSIPHIYSVPFYVYAYSFGQLLVLSLYQQYKQEGESFKPRYLKLLSTGGSEAPASILSQAGIDIRQAAFWQGGYDVVAALVRQLEALPIEKTSP